jgi:putative ABC transport system permease protein
MNRHFAQFLAKLRHLFITRRADQDSQRELDAHLALLEQDYLEQGHTITEARRRARIAVGGVEPIRQAQRDARSFLWLSQAGQDVRHAIRAMRRAPGFTIAAVLTLALGIGANTAVFSVINAVLLRSLDYSDPDRIVQFFLMSKENRAIAGQSIPDLRFLLDRATPVQDIAAYDFDQSQMGLTSGLPMEVHGIHVTSNYFRLFRAPVLLGHAFDQTEDQVNGPRVVVLSYGLWKGRFGEDRGIIGKTISLDKESYTVAGVMGGSFHSIPDAQLWIPFQFDLNSTNQLHSFMVAARLKPGITLGQANAQLTAASDAAKHASEFPDPDFQYQVRRLHDALVGDIRPSLMILQAAVGLVLLIACANIANLLMVRMTVRRREFGIRAAIGAGAGRIFRQLVVESLLLSFLGCAAGAFVGIIGLHLLLKVVPGNLLPIAELGATIGLDHHVLAFALGLSIATSLIFAILPAIALLRSDLTDTLGETGARQSLGRHTKALHSLTIISEVALSLILLIGAALLIRTMISLNRVDPGFDSHHVLVLTMPVGGSEFTSGERLFVTVRQGRDELNALPGVEASAASFSPPFTSRMGLPFSSFSGSSEVSGSGEWLAASPGYFQVLKIPVLRGRAFDERDKAGGVPVVMINQTMASHYWPHRNPVGQTIVIGKGLGPKFVDKPRTIIGVFGNTHDDDLAQPWQATMIIPDAQQPDGIVELMSHFGPICWIIRTRLEPQQVIPAISEVLRKATGGRPVGEVRSLDEMLVHSMAMQRFNGFLLATFASIALLLSAVGVYGVIAYSVAQRGPEIGIRMAVGADRQEVRNMVLREALVGGTLGIFCGALAAFFLARLLAKLLFGVSAHDVGVFVAMPLLLEIVTALAALIPAQRASKLDPVRALRGD